MNKHFLPQLTDMASMAKRKYAKQHNFVGLPIEHTTTACTTMQAFANQLAEVRGLDTKGEFKQSLDELETKYQFTLLRSLTLFNKEMSWAHLTERLNLIKECLSNTDQPYPVYPSDLPFTGWNTNIMICRNCKHNTLHPRQFSNELCCENCELLEPLDGVTFDPAELYACGDYKVVKRRRATKRYNFRYYLNKHMTICNRAGYQLSHETVQRANDAFDIIEEHLPGRISMPFTVYKILKEIVPEGPEHYILNYFWLQVPRTSVAKHEEKWQNMLRKFAA